MDEPNDKERRLILEVGNLVVLHQDGPAGGFPMAIAVDRVSKGLHWFLGCCDPLGIGESLLIESPVHDDARYVTRATIAASAPRTFALKLNPIWERVQQRAFVRIFAHGLQVRVVRPSDETGTIEAEQTKSHNGEQEEQGEAQNPGATHDLIDISAGGIRFRSNDDYEPEEQIICHFELPGADCFVLPARIIRPSESLASALKKPTVAVEFTGLAESTRTQLLRWVYREQVRRHRDENRDEIWD